MGKRERRLRESKNARARLEEFLAKGDTRGAVEAAKVLVREEPGAASESLAVKAYAERIKALIAEGLGREAAAIAAIVRERFSAHVGSHTALLDDARLAGGDLDWILCELRTASDEGRAALEERLLPWLADPAVIARSSAMDAADPLAREAKAVAELFEVVTSRIASTEEMARLNDIRRRSPLAPWKLLVRAIDAFHRNEDDRVAANVAAIDVRSPAARGGEVLSELTTGRKKVGASSAAERLVDRISGGRATIAAQIRSIEAAAKEDDRRRLREEVRAFAKSFDKLSPYAVEQVRLALLPICGVYFEAEQVASLFRIEDDAAMARYAAIIMETTGAPFVSPIWIAYADSLLEAGTMEPWQAAEIYLHALSLGGDDDDDFVCRDPSHDHPVEELPDSARVIEKIIASKPAPSVLARLTPYFERLESRELRRVLTAWRKNDPNAPEPLVRLLDLAAREGKYGEAFALIQHGDGMKILDPKYARLRLRVLFRQAEQLLAGRKRVAAEKFLAEIARRPEDLGEDAGTYLLALEWAAAPPAKAGELLAELARRGVVGELAVAEVTGDLRMPFALPASHPSPEELFEGIRRGVALFRSIGKIPRHSSWLIERAAVHLDLASEAQLLGIGSTALACRMNALAWRTTDRGLEIGGPMLHRMLLLRAEILLELHADSRRTALAIEAARVLAQRAHDSAIMERATKLTHRLQYFHDSDERLSQNEITAIIDHERDTAMPGTRKQTRKKTSRPKKSKSKSQNERDLFEP